MEAPLITTDVIDLEVHFSNFKEDARSREELAAAGGLAPAVRLWMCLAQLANEDAWTTRKSHQNSVGGLVAI
jgi:dihydroorotase-like cyclic amidohydrolase